MRLERLRDTGVPIPEDAESIALLAGLLASGDYLAGLLLAEPTRLRALLDDPWLHREKPRETYFAEVGRACAGVRSFADLQRALRLAAQREMLRLGAREIGAGIGPHALMLPEYGLTLDVAHELSAFADACLDAAVRFCEGELRRKHGAPACRDGEPGFSVIAMGKLGGDELNFSSDIDVIYVYASDEGAAGELSLHEYYARLSKAVTRAISENTSDGFVFRVDLRLRPEGQAGAICNSIAASESYYETFGRTWERQALLRARHAAGDAHVGERFLTTVAPFVYPRLAGSSTIEDVRTLRRMFVEKKAQGAWNVKLGTGGIRDVELVAQVLQLLYAGKRRDLRERMTVPALHKLRLAGLLTDQEVRTLTDAYRLWRRIEHRVQLENGQQTHTLPADEEGLVKLAKRLGFAGIDAFTTAIEEKRAAVCAIADTLGEPIAGPSPAVLRMLSPSLSTEELHEALAANGFRDLEQSAYSLELSRARLPPEWLEEAIASPDPDRALAFFRDLALRASLGLFALLRDDRQLLRMLGGLFGTSERLSRHLVMHPEVWPVLVRELGEARPDPALWQADLAARLESCNQEDGLRCLRRFQGEEILRIGLHDVAGELGPEEVSDQLCRLAEICLQRATNQVAAELGARYGLPSSELTIVVLGSCGAREMRYGSDLELVFLYESEGATSQGMDHQEWFARLAQRLIGALGALLEEGRLYTVDTRLRPSGSQGLLVTSYRSFEAYHHEQAAIWERMALLRGRPACVLPAASTTTSASGAFAERLERVAYTHTIGDQELREELLRMRKLVENERAGRKGTHMRFSPGGLTDLEFMAAWFQLRLGPKDAGLHTTTPRLALAHMAEQGVVAPALLEHYNFLSRASLRLRLLRDQPDDRLSPNDQTALARSLGLSPNQLLAELSRRMSAVRAAFLKLLA